MEVAVSCKGSTEGKEQEQDNFSKLPLDCLISIFAFVDRDTLDEAERVSKCIRDIVNHPSLKKIKTRGELVVYERYPGHTVSMKTNDHQLSFFIGNETGQGRPTGVRKRVETRYLNPYSRGSPPGTLDRGESTFVPSQILDNMDELLKKHTADQTSFEWILIDNSFVERCARALSGTVMKKLTFHNVMFDESLDLERFGDFLSSVDFTHLDMFLREQGAPTNFADFLRIFDDKFLSHFHFETPDFRPSFKLCFGYTIWKLPYKWAVSQDIFPIVCRFDVLELHSWTFEPEALVQLILMRLDMIEKKSSWTFALLGDEDTVLATLKRIDSRKYSVKPALHPDDETIETGTIIRKINSNFCCNVGIGDEETGHTSVGLGFYEYQE